MTRAGRRLGHAVLALALVAWGQAPAAEPAASQVADQAAAKPLSVFDLPAIARALNAGLQMIAVGQLGEALPRLKALAERYPEHPDPEITLALAEVLRGNAATAETHLDRALDLGFADLDRLLEDRRFRQLGNLDNMPGRIARSEMNRAAGGVAVETRRAVPSIMSVEGLSATVAEGNTEWNPQVGLLVPRFEMPPVLTRRPVIGKTNRFEKIAPFLNRWYLSGSAAGNVGDLYDNRDRDHSLLNRRTFPQLVHVEYDAAADERGLAYGPNRTFAFDRITIGNSSTAIVRGAFWRSQARQLLTEAGGAESLFRQYSSNALYVYPEKADHDAEHGDVMPANTPYYLLSQGASGSDRPFLNAFALALAALSPETKRAARERGIVAPTLQMLLRHSMEGIITEEAYLSARAHPSVFLGEAIDYERLVKAARRLTPDTLPPLVRLSVLSETVPVAERSYFAPPLGERLFTTPSAIARAFRGAEHLRHFRVSARQTEVPEGQSVRFVWKLLRGDAERVRIEPGGDGATAEITVPWHDWAPVPGRPDLQSRRVDIAVFATNGAEWSAPAFLTITFPPRQIRRYGADGRVLEIDYAPKHRTRRYADPMVWPLRDWRDVYRYAEDGRVIGWTRHRGDGTRDYTAAGHLVLSRDAEGRPREAERVRYQSGTRARNGQVRIEIVPTGQRVLYEYDGPEDLVGRIRSRGFTD